MSAIVVFGAGGNAGRRSVTEAVARGHRVTAVVRDPTRHADLAGPAVTLVAGDVTEPRTVAEVAAGHDAVLSSVYAADAGAEFYVSAAHALLDGVAKAGVSRLVVVSVGSVLEIAPGVTVADAPDFPADYRPFYQARAAELAVFRAADTDLDWLVVAPPPTMLDSKAPRTSRYRIGGGQVLPAEPDAPPLPYADLAVALVDEALTPKHHRALVAVAG